MNRRILLFGLLFAAQLAIPFWLIGSRELALHFGQRVLFRVEPVDPYDAFRGRYVRLGFLENSFETPGATNFSQGEPIVISFTNDKEGFAKVCKVGKNPVGKFWVNGKTGYVSSGVLLTLDYPFDAFYMDEVMAPKAEAALRRNWSRDESLAVNAHIAVRLWRGNAVIENLFLNNQPVMDYLRSQPAK
ncbi:MAG: GDYXXLXY domain-containing protein [Spirochaetia bacterium]|nr:GDYXXLXY domain-containing protein [Spirochaetia bacterium]